MCNLKEKFIKFLTFVLFFNFLFLHINYVFAMSASNVGTGPKDRVRTYEQQGFTYSRYEGFNCSVGGLIPKGGGLGTNDTDGGVKSFKDKINKGGIVFAAFLGKTLIHFAECSAGGLLITGLVSSVLDYTSPEQRTSSFQTSQQTKGLSSSLTTAGGAILGIAALFFDNMLDEWIEWALGQDDYQIDGQESSCSWIKITDGVICGIIMIVMAVAAAFVDNILGKIIMISIAFIISAIVDAILMLITLIPFEVAATNFDKISLCGDEWLTVGNDELEDKIKDAYDTQLASQRILLNRTSELKYITSFNDDHGTSYQHNGFGVSSDGEPPVGSDFGVAGDKLPIKYYPVKGNFNGSYKYILEQCFGKRNFVACKKLFKDIDSNTDLKELFTYNNKRYREFVYGGMEYEYTGCTDNRDVRKDYGSGKGQLYYFRGTEPTNFACERFLTDSKLKNDYKCCVEASQKLVCIKSKVKTGNNRQPSGFSASDTSNIGFAEVYTMCNKDNEGNCSLPLSKEINVGASDDTCTAISKLFGDGTSDGKISEALREANADIDANSNQQSDGNSIDNMRDSMEKKSELSKINKERLMSEAGCSGGTSTSTDEGGKSRWRNISFKVVKSLFESDKYCVQTSNLCPYNFYIAGGTEYYGSDFSDTQKENTRILYNEQDDELVAIGERAYSWAETKYAETRNSNLNCDYFIDEESRSCNTDDDSESTHCKFGLKICKGMAYKGSTNGSGQDEYYDSYRKPSNFCQLDRHCVYIPKPATEIKPKDFSAYLDKACLNFVGSSHNFEGYKNINATSTVRLSNQKTLLAPIVECTVETLKHMLLNEAGHTKCVDPRDVSYDDKTCDSGTEYIRGQQLDEVPDYKNKNSFLTVKKALENSVKALVVLMVCIMGFQIAFGDHRFDGIIVLQKSVMLIFVLYFALSNNWVRPVFKAVFGISNSVVSLAYSAVSEKDNPKDNNKYYGCYFFKNGYIDNNYDSYGDRNYLAIFDTFDCKVSLYMGFMGDTMRHPPILGIVVASILTFGMVILLLFPYVLIFAGLILIILKVAFIFISSNLICVLLLFLSPIMIPMILFERTKNIFNSWLKTIEQTFYTVGMLIIGVAIFLTIFDKYFIGDARFIGEKTPIRDVYCGKICKISDDNIIYLTDNDTEAEIKCSKEFDGKVIDLQYDAPICFLTSKLKTKTTGFGALDFLIGNVVFVANLVISTALMFTNFLNMAFLCILIYLFDQFIGYISSTSKSIFGAGFNDDMFGAGALPTLSEVMKSATNIMSNVAGYGHRNNPLTIASKRHKIGENEKVDRGGIDALGDEGGSALDEDNSEEKGNKYDLHVAGNADKDDENKNNVENRDK